MKINRLLRSIRNSFLLVGGIVLAATIIFLMFQLIASLDVLWQGVTFIAIAFIGGIIKFYIDQ